MVPLFIPTVAVHLGQSLTKQSMQKINIGAHTVELKSQIVKKDIIPLSRLQKIYDESQSGAEANAETMVEMNDLLIEIMVVSIDGKTDKKEIKNIVDDMPIPDYTEISRLISESMQEFQKKSEISSMSTSAS